MNTIRSLLTITLANLVIVAGLAGWPLKPGRAEVPEPLPLASPVASASPVVRRTVVRKVVSQPAGVIQPQPVAANSAPANPPPAAPSPPPQTSNQCLIVIDGSRYDVTEFRNRHSGGNIFQCGTDMSQVFWSRHNQAILQKMQRYRV